MSDCERIKKKHQQKITDLERTRSDSILRYGKYWPNLLAEVEKQQKAGKFRKKPYGPLGSHVSIKDMRFVLGAERALC